MTHLIEDPAVYDDLRERVRQLDVRFCAIFGSRTYDEAWVAGAALWWSEALLGNMAHEQAGNVTGEDAARQVLDNLVDPVERRRPEFWGTPLGRALAWWTGGEEAAELQGDRGVHRSEAAAALGISRQAVQKSITERPRYYDPQEASPTGVSAAGLRRAMRERFPRSE